VSAAGPSPAPPTPVAPVAPVAPTPETAATAGTGAMLVTGAGGYFGRRLVARLRGLASGGAAAGAAAPRVLGADCVASGPDIATLDLRAEALLELLAGEKVEAICHLLWFPEALEPEAAFRANVMGAMRIVAAARRAGVRYLLVRSSTSVYGHARAMPAFIPEEWEVEAAPRDGRARHLLEVESFVEGFTARNPVPAVGVLRFAPVVGPASESRLMAYLRGGPVRPVAMGYDPRIQLIHEDDVVDALAHALGRRHAGAVNVAAPGVVPLRRVLRLLGKTAAPVPHPLLPAALALEAELSGRPYLALDADFLRFAPVGDTTRMERDLGFRPRVAALEAIRELAAVEETRDAGARAADRDAAREERNRLRETVKRLAGTL